MYVKGLKTNKNSLSWLLQSKTSSDYEEHKEEFEAVQAGLQNNIAGKLGNCFVFIFLLFEFDFL